MDSIFGFSVKNDSRAEVASINGKILQGEKGSVPSWKNFLALFLLEQLMAMLRLLNIRLEAGLKRKQRWGSSS
jgi:hypothetical protein